MPENNVLYINSRIKYMDASSVSEMMKAFNARKKMFITENKIVSKKGYFLFRDRIVWISAAKTITDSKMYGTISVVYRMMPDHIERIDV